MIIHTPTLADYINVVKDAFSEGIRWTSVEYGHLVARGRDGIRERQWDTYGTMTCINKGSILLYASKGYYISNKFQVLSIEEYYRHHKRYALKNILKGFI